MAMTTRDLIGDFLDQSRLAFVGVSRDPQDFSRKLFHDLRQRGYDVVPVNPNLTEVDGQPCFARLQDITPPVEGALLMTPPEQTEQIVRDCVEAGITRVWMHRGVGTGTVSKNAIDVCNEQGIEVIPGFCPYMFLPNTWIGHRMHGWVKKLTGSYPT